MNFLNHFAKTASDGIDATALCFFSFFQHFMTVVARPDTITLIMLVGGLVCLILLALYMIPSRSAVKPDPSRRGVIFNPKPRLNRPNRDDAVMPDEAEPIGGEPIVREPIEEKLAEIEREMLALKELYETGRIIADVYLRESRALYEKAKALS